MSIKENKRILQRYFDEVLNGHDYSHIDDIMVEDFNGRPAGGGTIGGKEAHKRYFEGIRAMCPDLRIETLEMVGEGDKVVALSRWHYTHTGADALGFPASGKGGTNEVMAMYTLKDGRLVGGKVLADSLAVFKAIGIVPASWRIEAV